MPPVSARVKPEAQPALLAALKYHGLD